MGKALLLDAFANRAEMFIDETNLTGKLVVHEIEDCEPYLEQARRLSEKEPEKEFRHAAVIPHFVYAKAYREGWANDRKAWKRWANDPANRMFRTWPGKLKDDP